MKVAFRTDASLQIGTGHVMRCLTLAEALKRRGAQCYFITRRHNGHISEIVQQQGFEVWALPPGDDLLNNRVLGLPAHAAWLGSDWRSDVEDTRNVLKELMPDWLVVDHYAIDFRWEKSLREYSQKLMVVDDLADRKHECDLLLDQNLGRGVSDYLSLVPDNCVVLAGSRNALLRPEFARLRGHSLQRRQSYSYLGKLLITMGGVDQPNATSQILDALCSCQLPSDCEITVVMGARSPWLSQVVQKAASMPRKTAVLVNTKCMAELMVESDMAIGAAGSTSWERCCLGLPTLMVVLAENQIEIGRALAEAGAAALLGLLSDSGFGDKLQYLIQTYACQKTKYMQMANSAFAVTDGTGADNVAARMLNL